MLGHVIYMAQQIFVKRIQEKTFFLRISSNNEEPDLLEISV
jgi:hypothetical protein